MKNHFSLTIFFILIISSLQLQADIWIDPEWKVMIDSSDVIALIEYTSQEGIRAHARALKVYKGEIEADTFLVLGLGHRFGVLNWAKVGNQSIVFLWRSVSKTEDKDAYWVPTRTSGDYPVKGQKVQCDLLESSYSRSTRFHELNEFEQFLNAASGSAKNKAAFHQQTLQKISDSLTHDVNAQYLMMLYLTSYDQVEPVFETIVEEGTPGSCYALAVLLGQIQGENPQKLLIQLLDNEYSLIQGEAVRQLAELDPAYIGPILLKHLHTTGKKGMAPDSVINLLSKMRGGGQIQIIKTLGELKYKPAAQELLPLLETDNSYLFEQVIQALQALENEEYVPYLNMHLKKGTSSLIFFICQTITNNKLEVCKPALMEFISNYDKNEHSRCEYAISTHHGLAQFDDQETREFLLQDFENLLAWEDGMESLKAESWIEEYIEVFTELQCEEARPLIYQALFAWVGLHQDFYKHPALFDIKKGLQDSLNTLALKMLKDHEIESVNSIAFIHNTGDFDENFTPKYEVLIEIRLKYEGKRLSGKETYKVLHGAQNDACEKLTLPPEKVLVRRSSNVTHFERRFDWHIGFSPFNYFYEYAIVLPDNQDVLFLKALADAAFFEKEEHQKNLMETIAEIEKELKE